MTTRFSLAELADMLHTSVQAVRAAVDALSEAGELTAESFLYQERNWRIAPSDVKRIKAWIDAHPEQPEAVRTGVRRVRRKQLQAKEPGSS